LRALLQRRSFGSRSLSMSAIVDDVVALTRNDALARKVKFETAIVAGDLHVLGDPVQLQQVLLNLVLNAMDAVTELPLERRRVRLQAQRHGEHEVEVAVTDSGTGIAPDRLLHLFQPFYTTKPNGLGIGLSISRTIVEAHGGRIWADNNQIAGATFRFTLPLAVEAISP
jgi:signal transduction histidine kinase